MMFQPNNPTTPAKLFFLTERRQRLSPTVTPKAYLIRDNWDDYSFKTYFHLVIFDENGNRHDLEGVKIGQFGLTTEQSSPNLPLEFDQLDQSFFSLGQSDNYYAILNQLSPHLKTRILQGLNDAVADLALFERALEESVTKTSLLRFVPVVTVRNQFRRLLTGGARLSRYDFSFKAPSQRDSNISPLSLSFAVEPESMPPTNIHVLIGRNGVGKTRMLNLMTRSLIDEDVAFNKFGTFSSRETDNEADLFANLVSVTFSAFDEFMPLRERRDKTAGLKYSYVGLKRFGSKEKKAEQSAKSPDMLRREFVNSLFACLKGSKGERWQRSMQMLETDPIFKEAEVATLIDDNTLANDPDGSEFQKEARQLFNRLSSGHKIVLLTMTRLVETVEERTLILLDEPEAHLHPPLLSAFIRALSDLLVYRNGVAIIATHSPVVLQEVPQSCVWKLRRNGEEAVAERPEIETFGENVGVLTREVFGLEVTQSGFHRLLQSAVEKNLTYKATLSQFNDELGAEARAILRSLIAHRDSEKEF